MILTINLFVSLIILVSSNSSPVIPQTLPIYQQNVYANPTANQPSDITPYLQGLTVQNQSPPLELSPSAIRQILLNKILSSAPLQTTLDQSLRNYGSNLVEYPSNPIALNPANDYFAAPFVSEYVNSQNNINKDENSADSKKKGKRKKNNKRGPSKSRRQHDNVEENHKKSSKKDKTNNTQDNNEKSSRNTKKRSRKQKPDESSNNNYNEEKKKKRKNKNREINPIDEDAKVENPKPRKRHKKRFKTDKTDTEKVDLEPSTDPKPNTVLNQNIHEGFDLAHFNEGVNEENRLPRTPKHEGNVTPKSIHKPPETFAQNFNGISQFQINPLMGNFYSNYENIYQSMLNNRQDSDKVVIKRRKPKKSKAKNKRKNVANNRNVTEEANVPAKSKSVVTPKLNVVTTEKTININERNHTNTDVGLKSFEKPEIEENTTKSNDNEEIGNDYEPLTNLNINNSDQSFEKEFISNGYIDDYYPLFSDSAAYNSKNREVYVKHLGDTKYYYATDKSNSDTIGRMRFENKAFPDVSNIEYKINKQKNGLQKESIKKETKINKEEETQFQSPPHLEFPDFETKKVEKVVNNGGPYYDFGNHDSNSFNQDKSPNNTKSNAPFYNREKQKQNKDIETFFAGSKVVKYGPAENLERHSFPRISRDPVINDNSYKAGGTTYVLAKALHDPETF